MHLFQRTPLPCRVFLYYAGAAHPNALAFPCMPLARKRACVCRRYVISLRPSFFIFLIFFFFLF